MVGYVTTFFARLVSLRPFFFFGLITFCVKPPFLHMFFPVTEKMSVPLIPSIHFKTRFTLLEEGSRWESWAPFGIYVDSNLTVTTSISKKQRDGLPNEQHEEAPTCQAVEVAVLSCPSFLYPYVRWQFDKSHEKNLSSIKQFIENNH